MGATYNTHSSIPTDYYGLQGKPYGYFLTRSAALQYILNTCIQTDSHDAKIYRDDTGRMHGFVRWFPDEGWALGYWIEAGVWPHEARKDEVEGFVEGLKVGLCNK
jgi:hypothetical protein